MAFPSQVAAHSLNQECVKKWGDSAPDSPLIFYIISLLVVPSLLCEKSSSDDFTQLRPIWVRVQMRSIKDIASHLLQRAAKSLYISFLLLL